MAGDGDACRGAWRKTEEEESEGLTGGPGGDFHFLFPFFFPWVVTIGGVEVGCCGYDDVLEQGIIILVCLYRSRAP